MDEQIKKWHKTFKEKLEGNLLLMQRIAMSKEAIGRLERLIKEREKTGIEFGYEEIRMSFSNEELQMIIDYKCNMVEELQEKCEALSKKYKCIKDAADIVPVGAICNVDIHNNVPCIFYNGIRICEIGSPMQKFNFLEVEE